MYLHNVYVCMSYVPRRIEKEGGKITQTLEKTREYERRTRRLKMVCRNWGIDCRRSILSGRCQSGSYENMIDDPE